MHGFSVRCIRSARILVNGHCRAVSVVNRTAALGGFDSIVHSGKATTTQVTVSVLCWTLEYSPVKELEGSVVRLCMDYVAGRDKIESRADDRCRGCSICHMLCVPTVRIHNRSLS